MTKQNSHFVNQVRRLDLPPIDTVHKFPEKHFDQKFISQAFNILERHHLRAIDPNSWHRSCWHSNYGYCLDSKNKIVFVKIFRPQLLENYQRELSTRILLEQLNISGLSVPRVVFSYPEDLCLVLEPVSGIVISNMLDSNVTRDKLLTLLASILGDIHVNTQQPSVDVNDWILMKREQYISSLSPFHEALNKFPQLHEILSQLHWLGKGLFSFALSDVTLTHLYWNKQSDALVLVDFELAGLRPEYYDAIYFCHRLLTRFPHMGSSTLSSTIDYFLKKFEEIIKPEDGEIFRNNIISLLTIRMLGGLVDCLVIEDGTDLSQQLSAWDLFLSIRSGIIAK